MSGEERCDHDTPRPLHDELWRVYFRFIGRRASPKNSLKVLAGPYHETIEVNNKKKSRSWVIVDLKKPKGPIHDKEKAKAIRLRDALNAVGRQPRFRECYVKARFRVLRKATSPAHLL